MDGPFLYKIHKPFIMYALCMVESHHIGKKEKTLFTYKPAHVFFLSKLFFTCVK
jgi:hypothetical protein